jgi:serine/threonine protein kinase
MDSGIDACSPTGMETGSPPKASWGDNNNQQHKMECVFEDEVLHSKRNIEPPMEMQSPVGSPEYMPPEIATLFLYGNGCYDEEGEEDGFDHVVHEFDRSYTQACDIWSLGVIAYVALCGKPPFAAIRENCDNVECKWNEGGACEQCQGSLFEAIYYANLQFSDPKWKEISSEAKHLISRCLDRNASTRISAYEILEHPFLQRLSRPTNTNTSSKPTTTTTTEVDGTVNKEFNHAGSSETKINNNNNNTRVVAATTTSSLLSEKFNSCCSLTETQLKELAHSSLPITPSSNKNSDESIATLDHDSGNCDVMIVDDHDNDSTSHHHLIQPDLYPAGTTNDGSWQAWCGGQTVQQPIVPQAPMAPVNTYLGHGHHNQQLQQQQLNLAVNLLPYYPPLDRINRFSLEFDE